MAKGGKGISMKDIPKKKNTHPTECYCELCHQEAGFNQCHDLFSKHIKHLKEQHKREITEARLSEEEVYNAISPFLKNILTVSGRKSIVKAILSIRNGKGN